MEADFGKALALTELGDLPGAEEALRCRDVCVPASVRIAPPAAARLGRGPDDRVSEAQLGRRRQDRRSSQPVRELRRLARRLTGDISTTPVLTIDGRSIGDSTRIIAAIEERWPQPPLYPEDEAQQRRALELEEFFDEELGPHYRRAMYHEMLPHSELLLARFTNGQPPEQQCLLRDRYPVLRAAMESVMDVTPETAAASRAKTVAAMDRLEREISPDGYLVGASFTVADLTAAALFYGVVSPPEFPYPTVARDDLPASWRAFFDSLAQRPGGRWVTEIYRRHRGRSAELTPAEAPPTLSIEDSGGVAARREQPGPVPRTAPDLARPRQTESASLLKGDE